MFREPEDMHMRDIEAELLDLHGQLSVRTTFDKARRIGHLLLEVKKRVGHGKYHSWLHRVGLKVRTAQTYVQVAMAPDAPATACFTIESFLDSVRAGRRVLRKERAAELAAGCTDPDLVPGIVHADSLDYMRGLASDSVPFIVTDPPYGMGMAFGDWTDASDPVAYWQWFEPYWKEMMRVLQPGGNIVVWQAYRHLPHLLSWFPESVIVASCFVIRGCRQWEPVIRWTKPGAKAFINFDKWNDWLMGAEWYRGETGAYKCLHPCPKPLNDAREIVRRYTLPGTLILDPFCGTGTIPLACQKEGRKYIGVDRYEPYVVVARTRLAKAD